MIPVQLDIQGLYSYRERQSINFNQLTAAGLFGIFGAVGSGKSSILEGILLALYGSTERLSDRGEKNSMLNLQSDQLLINFTFHAGKNNSKTFLARYEAKRNKKDPEKVDPATHTFYEKSGSDWTPLELRAEDIIGMKKEHFKQTVIIPQGKFREFIDLTPGPRAEMMKELFGLERFDLSGKTGTLLREVKDEKIRLEAKIQTLEEYSSEQLSEKSELLEKIKTESDQVGKEVNDLDAQLRQLEKFQEKHASWIEFKRMRKELVEQKPQIDKQRLLHQEFITAKNHLRPIWNQINDLKKDREKFQVSITDCSRFEVEFEKEILQLEVEEKELKQKNQNRPQREGKIRDLKKVIEIKQLQEGLAQSQAHLETLKPSIDSLQETQSNLDSQSQNLDRELDSLPVADSSNLADLKSFQRQWKDLDEQIGHQQKLLKQFESEEKVVSQTLERLQSKIPSDFEKVEDWLQEQKKRISEVEKMRENALRNMGLHAHAHLLEDGKPCPLCGAAEHPNPLSAEKQEKEARQMDLRLSEEKNVMEDILHLIQQLKEQQLYLDNHRRNIQSKGQEKLQLDEKLSNVLNQVNQLGITDSSSLEEKIASLENSHQQRESILKAQQEIRKNWQANREKLDMEQAAFQQAQLKKETFSSQIQSKEKDLQDPTFCKVFFSRGVHEIDAAISKVEKDIENALKDWEGKVAHLQEVKTKQTTNQADLKNFKLQLEQADSKLSKLQSEFENLKTEHGFEDEARLIRLFEHSLDAEKVAKEIQQFDQRLALAESRISELEQEKEVVEFQEEQFLQSKAKFHLLKSAAEESRKRAALLEEEIKIIKEKLQEKLQLTQTKEKVEKRETYLRELERLFKGSGFVKYVSSIYLKELCNTANLRFMKLSKNSLSLEIDDDNTFWVIDYLNGGKRRLLKTLSGGQTFQASLCLALALAEKIKALNQADQSFFFLDEGFGALDRNALRVVFETLKSLRHENRIVGIISHVEELQQEIGVFAKVELDQEKGSQVSYSY
ncbi:AAA family ATPase [Algoriphagus zhangzhouensis]|uniref:Exonuclease SbcC n=1 Tax=Algoriphagus zhangzhouensis TaxID=1073327 RepID=A0A1M7ZGL4_9BACT|nr:SMC family ATPase [Algoriphagus zhangzhouensis]TDY44658.1 exonuclease SbcC [Algoriphagus zhangzhouensis]SHO64050.1 exonuclease SbcC [Algoriphagus zhangzhouensis]